MKAAATLVLRPGKDRSLIHRHPWLYPGSIGRIDGRPVGGDLVRVVAADGRFMAWGAYSPASTLRARMWSFREEEFPDDPWLEARLAQAIARRDGLVSRSNALRLVFGEADRLPGLVVDRYDQQLVVQFLAAGVEARRKAIIGALARLTGCAAIHERSDAATRSREGLEPREGPLLGPALAGPVEVNEDGVRYQVDVLGGHKTGFYIDQRDNRRLLASMAQGRTLLNCFCYTGGFTLAALKFGAREAWSVDSSADALERARAQQALNGLAGPSHWLGGDVFETLKSFLQEGRSFDLIVLDPPKFAPSAQHVDRAARAYKQLNMLALRLLAPHGRLFTFSCSGAVSVDLFQKIVAGAAFDARVDAQMIARLQAGEDHPVLITHPEGEYLKGLLLQRI
jgi:23S rRNA (cytosine1962-C5)-methyltransferase